MKNGSYNRPSIEKVAGFKSSTKGFFVGRFRDVFGGKAIFHIQW